MNIFASLHLIDIEAMNYLFLTLLDNSEVSKYPGLPFLILIAGEQIKYPDGSHLCYLLKTQILSSMSSIQQIGPSLVFHGLPWAVVSACSATRNRTVFKRKIEKELYPNCSQLLNVMPDGTQSEFFIAPGSF